jgi:phosphosulfolactate synthase
MKSAYSAIPMPGTTPKPRDTRITMMIDWGIPYSTQADILEMGGQYCDLAKIAVGLAGLVSEDALRKKLKIYSDYRVDAFPGGMFLEYAYFNGVTEKYLQATADLRFPYIEVSDNSIRFPGDEKYALIRRCISDYGLRVIGEAGRKYEKTDVGELIADVNHCLEAGCWKVFVEAAEFFEGSSFQKKLVEQLAAAIPLDGMIFELPGAWIKDIHQHDIHRLMVSLFEMFGPSVNIGNVPPDLLLTCEMLRQGIGVNMKVEAERAVAAH